MIIHIEPQSHVIEKRRDIEFMLENEISDRFMVSDSMITLN